MNNYMKIIINALKQWVEEKFTVVNSALKNKVDRVAGKGLSTEDFTTEEKIKLQSLSTEGGVSSWNDLTDRPFYEAGATIKTLDSKFIGSDIARVADIPEVPVTSVNGMTGDIIIEIPENGGSGVSSWNDLTDRPFGETVTKTNLLDNVTTTVTTSMQLPFYFSIESDKQYEVIFNGTTYMCSPFVYYGMQCIGNLYHISGGTNTGEPFAFADGAGAGQAGKMQGFFAEAGTYTISVSSVKSELVKIDPIYLPDLPEEENPSWNDLTDRPFYEHNTGGHYEWDGQWSSLTYTSPAIYKISDATPEPDEFVGAVVVYSGAGGVETTYNITSANINYYDNTKACFISPKQGNVMVYYDGNTQGVENGIYLSAGVYNPTEQTITQYTKSLTYGTTTLQTLDEKFIPDTIARVEQDYIVLKSSTSGSTKKFKVTVNDSGTLTATQM